MRTSKFCQPHLLLFLMLATVFPCASCRDGTAAADYHFKRIEWAEREPDMARMQALAADNNQFAFELYQEVARANEGNLAISPYSVSSSLALVYGGAKGETKRQLAEVMHFELDETVLHDAFADQEYRIESIISWGGPCFLANSLWPQSGYEIPEVFAWLAEDKYNTEIHHVDFHNPREAAAKINAWTSTQTDGKLSQVADARMFSEYSRLMLVNAFTFTQCWDANEFFKVENTDDELFRPALDEEVQVRMMHRQAGYHIALEDEFSALRMPLFSECSMLVILPQEPVGLAAVEDRLDARLLDEIAANQAEGRVDVSMPRMIVDSEVDLIAPLKQLGISELFEWNSELAGIVSEEILPMKVSDLVHDVYMKVNEDGVEAAAATAGQIMALGFHPIPDEVITFRADHPFFFLIQDDKTGAVLFMCRVVNPAEHGNQPEVDEDPNLL